MKRVLRLEAFLEAASLTLPQALRLAKKNATRTMPMPIKTPEPGCNWMGWIRGALDGPNLQASLF